MISLFAAGRVLIRKKYTKNECQNDKNKRKVIKMKMLLNILFSFEFYHLRFTGPLFRFIYVLLLFIPFHCSLRQKGTRGTLIKKDR